MTSAEQITAFRSAVERADDTTASDMIHQGFRPGNLRAMMGEFSLNDAIVLGCMEKTVDALMAKMPLDLDTQVSKFNNNPLLVSCLAMRNPSESYFKKLLDHDADPYALELHRPYFIRYKPWAASLVDEAQKTYEEKYPERAAFKKAEALLRAVTGNNLGAAQKMLNLKANPNTPANFMPLESALFGSNSVQAADMLLKAGARMDANSSVRDASIALQFFKSDKTEFLPVLQRHGYDFEKKLENGMTALQTAVAADKAVMVAALVELGANVTAPMPGCLTPLEYAKRNGRKPDLIASLREGEDRQLKRQMLERIATLEREVVDLRQELTQRDIKLDKAIPDLSGLAPKR